MVRNQSSPQQYKSVADANGRLLFRNDSILMCQTHENLITHASRFFSLSYFLDQTCLTFTPGRQQLKKPINNR